MAMITVPRVGGLALIIGSALYIASTLIMSSMIHINGEGSDLNAIVDAIADAPSLTWFSAVSGGVGAMFMLWGLTVMWQTAQSPCVLDTFVKFGLVSLMLALVSFFMSDVLVYTTSHIVDHGIGESAYASQFGATAMHMQSMAGSARLMGSISGLMGYVVLGFALARKFRPGAYKTLAFVVGIGAVISLVGVVLTEPFHEIIDTLTPIFAVLSILYLVWLIVIGIGIYQKRFGLRIGVTPEH